MSEESSNSSQNNVTMNIEDNKESQIQPPENITIPFVLLTNLHNILVAAGDRGAFKTAEMYDIGRVYNEVKERFQDPEVEICRMTSDRWFKLFQNHMLDFLDWIYIDGDHSYEGCLRDLENSLKVVRQGGLILGDDYGWPNAKWFKPGVTKAVDEFINKHKFTKMLRHGETQYEIRI